MLNERVLVKALDRTAARVRANADEVLNGGGHTMIVTLMIFASTTMKMLAGEIEQATREEPRERPV